MYTNVDKRIVSVCSASNICRADKLYVVAFNQAGVGESDGIAFAK
jgi:hypothetical protein